MLPITEDITERVLGLPIFIKMTNDQQDLVVNNIRKVIEN